MWQSNTSTLPSRRYQKSAVGKAILAPVGSIGPTGVWSAPRKVPWIVSWMQNHVAAHGDLLQRPVNVGKEVGQIDDQTAQLRTLKALLGDHIADAVEHTVRCEQIPEPLRVQGITLAVVAALPIPADHRRLMRVHRR